MKINFLSYEDALSKQELSEYAEYLTRLDWEAEVGIVYDSDVEGLTDYFCVDVVGRELIWMNDTFTKDKFTWYHWYESVFLVPENMLPFLKLRWS